MQLSKSGRKAGVRLLAPSSKPQQAAGTDLALRPQVKPRGFIATGAHIVAKESPLGLYKGLGAVVTGIVPKMAIRFASFEQYKALLANKQTGVASSSMIFLGASRLPSLASPFAPPRH